MNARGIARLGTLAVGLGLGAAWAHTPVASADSSSDWLSTVDGLLSGASPAPATPIDLDISFDGYTIYDGGGSATAITTPGDFDFAIASGADSYASATGGFGDSASASGAGSEAVSGGGFGDYAAATNGGVAVAGDNVTGATGNNFDSASASGIGNSAYAGDFDDSAPDTTGSSFDSASAGGGTAVDPDVAYAGFNGSGDTAHASGQNVEVISGFSLGATAANNDTASAYGNLTTPTTGETEAFAGSESGAGGSGDTAFVIDPSGTVGSSAIAGEGSNYDLAGVFGDGLHATATGANFLVDILPSL